MRSRNGWSTGAALVSLAVVLLPAATWLISTSGVRQLFGGALPPGQTAYVLSKLAGLLAFAALWLQCIVALAGSTPFLRGFPRPSGRTHAILGTAVLGLAVAHVGLFTSATAARAGHWSAALLLPRIEGSYYERHVGLGAAALWLLSLGLLAGWRRRRGGRPWALIHHLWPATFALGLIHALAIGTESRLGPMQYLLGFMGVSLATAALSTLHGTWGRKGALPARMAHGTDLHR